MGGGSRVPVCPLRVEGHGSPPGGLARKGPIQGTLSEPQIWLFLWFPFPVKIIAGLRKVVPRAVFLGPTRATHLPRVTWPAGEAEPRGHQGPVEPLASPGWGHSVEGNSRPSWSLPTGTGMGQRKAQLAPAVGRGGGVRLEGKWALLPDDSGEARPGRVWPALGPG